MSSDSQVALPADSQPQPPTSLAASANNTPVYDYINDDMRRLRGTIKVQKQCDLCKGWITLGGHGNSDHSFQQHRGRAKCVKDQQKNQTKPMKWKGAGAKLPDSTSHQTELTKWLSKDNKKPTKEGSGIVSAVLKLFAAPGGSSTGDSVERRGSGLQSKAQSQGIETRAIHSSQHAPEVLTKGDSEHARSSDAEGNPDIRAGTSRKRKRIGEEDHIDLKEDHVQKILVTSHGPIASSSIYFLRMPAPVVKVVSASWKAPSLISERACSATFLPMVAVSVNDKLRGCIVGGALGDAIGLFTEFLSAEQARELYGTNPRFKLRSPAPKGYYTMHMDRHRAVFEEAAWTDDTDQALLILMSFLHSGGNGNGIDPLDFAKRIKHWVQFGFRPLDRLPLGLGRTVGSVVRDAAFLDDPIATSTKVWERGDRFMAANGAVMRTAVIGGLYFNKEELLYSSAINIAATTHADPRCLVSCTIASALVAAIIRDEVHSDADVKRVVDAAIAPVTAHDPPLTDKHIEELNEIIWKESLVEMELDERQSIGYTYKALASGIWVLRQGIAAINNKQPEHDASYLPSVFERAITDLTMAAGDADTNAAVAGPLLGALLGYSNLPPQWCADLKHCDWLLSKADAATYLITNEGQAYDYEHDADNLIDGGKGEMTKDELDAKWAVMIETLHRRTGDFEKFEKMEKDRKKREEGCIIV